MKTVSSPDETPVEATHFAASRVNATAAPSLSSNAAAAPTRRPIDLIRALVRATEPTPAMSRLGWVILPAIALVIRLAYVATLPPTIVVTFEADPITYDQIATNILSGKGFSGASFYYPPGTDVLTSFWDPLYPYFLDAYELTNAQYLTFLDGTKKKTIKTLTSGLQYEVIKAGDVFGAGALVTAEHRRYGNARALEASQVLVMNREKFLFAVQESPMFAIELLASIDQRLRQLKDCTKV